MSRRLTVSLEHEIYEAVSGVAEVRGVSRTAVINELLGAAVPSLVRIVDLMKAAEKMTDAERSNLLVSLGGIADDFSSVGGDVERRLRSV